MAKGDFIPGLSDIDLTFVFCDSVSDAVLYRARKDVQNLAVLFPWFDLWNQVLTERQFISRPQTNDLHFFQYLEGKKSWKLLWGENVLDRISLDPRRLFASVFLYYRIYWKLFNRVVWNSKPYRFFDIAFQERTLFKVSIETFRLVFFCREGRVEFNVETLLRSVRQDTAGIGDLLNFLDFCKAKRFRKLYREKYGVEGIEKIQSIIFELMRETMKHLYEKHREDYFKRFNYESNYHFSSKSYLNSISGKRTPIKWFEDIENLNFSELSKTVLRNRELGFDTIVEDGPLRISCANIPLTISFYDPNPNQECRCTLQ